LAEWRKHCRHASEVQQAMKEVHVSTSASSAELLDAVPALQWMRPLWRVLSADSISSRYDSFGKQTSSSGSLTNPFQFTARESDPETNLYFYRARYFDPHSGHFISEDPIWGGEDGKPNFYVYASNDPVDRFDPLGLSDLIYLTGSNTIVLLDGNGNMVSIYPAANNVASIAKNDDGVTQTLPYPQGTYP
jgi:RHS repeat-associated protein